MLKFALVGCGRIAKRHADLLSQNLIEGAILDSVCDHDEERAAQYSKTYDVPAFADMNEMVLTRKPDVISVLTPSGLHAEHVIELSKHGLPIIVEKPMAMTLEDADRMIKACDKNGAKLFVVKQNRYNLPVVKMREALEQGRFGRLNLGTIRVRWRRDQSYYDQDSWRGTWKHDGGVLTNQASHHIDLLQWMMGDVESVTAKSRTFLVDIEAEDTAVAIIKFKSGALGMIEATTATRPKDLEGSISVLGEGGTVEIEGFAVNQMRHWNFNEKTSEDAKVLDEFKENPPDVYGFGHRRYLNHVVQALNTGTDFMVMGEEGKKSIEIITALYESIETGKEITFPFTPEKCRLGKD